jgi:type IV pilus assembly protein PilY1
VFFGGGYDISQDQQPYVADNVGRGLYMVDAETGALMWRAGPDGGADLQLTDMTNSSPADVRVIDLTGDGFDDRIYMADLGGRIWRFDIFNGKPVSAAEGDRLMEGGLLASLGNADQAAPRTQSNTIRFFYSPDPALITKPGPNYVNVAIGSGHREMPASDTTSVNWFFSVRDFNVYTQLRSSWYQDDCSTASTPCHETLDETDLVDLTNIVGPAAEAAVPVATASPGWKIQLGVSGEKALAESRTFQDAVYFTTYAPETITSVSVACGTAFGQNRLYVVSAQDARPINNFDAVVGESAADRSKKLAQGSIAPEVVFVFPTPPVDPNDPNALPPAVPPVCLVGLESCGFGLLNPPVRTYWWQHDSN